MPRYYFKLWNSEEPLDKQGIELPDNLHAKAEAAKYLANLIAVIGSQDEDDDLRIDVRNQNGDPIFCVILSATATRAPTTH